MRDGHRVIDSDGHTIEPEDIYERFLDAPFTGRVGRLDLVDQTIVRPYTVDGRPTQVPQYLFGRGREAARWTPDQMAERYGAATARGFDAPSVVADMDREGVDVVVIYGPGHDMWVDGIDPILQAAMCRAYNRWLAEYGAESGGRIRGAGPIPVQDVHLAVQEVTYAHEELGLASFWIRPNPFNRRTLGDRYWDPLYELLVDIGSPLGIHEFFGADVPAVGRDRFSNYLEWHTVLHLMEQQMAMLAMLARGVFERHPRLQVGYLEAGAAWVPSWLHRIEEHQELTGWFEAPELTRSPLEYFRDHCYVTVEPDEALLAQTIAEVGDRNILFATDYPHPEAYFPKAVDTFLSLPGVAPESFERILWENPVRFYGLDPATLPTSA